MIFGKRFAKDALRRSEIQKIIEDAIVHAEERIIFGSEIVSDIYREALFEIKDLLNAI